MLLDPHGKNRAYLRKALHSLNSELALKAKGVRDHFTFSNDGLRNVSAGALHESFKDLVPFDRADEETKTPNARAITPALNYVMADRGITSRKLDGRKVYSESDNGDFVAYFNKLIEDMICIIDECNEDDMYDE